MHLQSARDEAGPNTQFTDAVLLTSKLGRELINAQP